MKKSIVIFSCLYLGLNSLQAQKKYEKIVYKDASVETEGLTILAKDAIATKEFIKFKIKITNKTDDIIVYKADESTMKINSKELKPKERPLVITPTESESRVVNFDGTDFMVNSYSYLIDGLYKVSTTKNPVETADFQLPPSQNEFKTGNFTCNMTDLEKETDKTKVKFECRYTGDKVGVIHPGRSAIKLPDGTEVANAKGGQSPIVVRKGESEKFTMHWNRMEGGKATDMQKIKLMIVWRNTFVESEEVKLKSASVDLQIDEAKSK